MVGYNCTCSSGFQGKHCDEQSTQVATNKPTTSPSTTMTERSDTTTSQSATTSESVESSTTDVATKTSTRPMTTVSDTTTSPETTASNSVKTEAKTKSEPSPTITMPERSEATTSQVTTTSKSAELSTTDATGKPMTSPTTTISDTTTSQDTITSKSAELSTTDVATKTATRPMTTVSATTTLPETTASTCSSPPVDCEFGGSFYNFSTSEMDHASAVSACSQYGSHLVFIESQEEEDFIARHVEYYRHTSRTYYWIGLTGSSLSEARWLDGSNLTYSSFNQDSFNDNVNCFRIKYQGQYSGWHGRDCSTQYRFICEKEVGI